MQCIMAMDRLWRAFVPKRVTRIICVCTLCWTCVVWAGSPGSAPVEANNSYVVKQYPDGMKTKIKWGDIGKVKDLSGDHGGTPLFRPPRPGELEKLKEEVPDQPKVDPSLEKNIFPSALPRATESPSKLSAQPSSPEKVDQPPPVPPLRSYEATFAPEREPRKVWVRSGERSALPTRIGPSIQYGQAFQDYGTMPFRLDPHPPELRPIDESSLSPELTHPFLPSLRGITLWDDSGQVVSGGIEGPLGIHSRLACLPEDEAKRLLRVFMNKPVSMTTLGEMRKVLLQFLTDKNKKVASVIVPEQEIKNGILQILVLTGKRGIVKVQGNRYFQTDNICP